MPQPLRKSFIFRFVASIVNVCFIVSFMSPARALAQSPADLGMPVPGTMVNLTPAYVPVLIKGLRVHPENPVLFDFIEDTGNSGFNANTPDLKNESEKLIKYFLASLTIPENDQWVNLSPYEKDRIIPDQLGLTEMGRDMLAQDYILKQITASLIYPEKELGKEFWNKVYTKAQQLYGNTQVPVNTFNKVWITADKADVYVHDNTAYIVGAHLKVMLEEDYEALQKHDVGVGSKPTQTNQIGSQIVREVVLPALENEVNTGKNFANLRQMFYSMILATWYKKNLKEALLNQVYSNKAKINGVNVEDKTIKEQIYQEYLKAYKKGVFNYIKEDIDRESKQPTPRKYFSGGIDRAMGVDKAMRSFQHFLPPESLLRSTGEVVVVTASASKTPEKVEPLSSNYVNALAGKLEAYVGVNPVGLLQKIAEEISKEGVPEGVTTLEYFKQQVTQKFFLGYKAGKLPNLNIVFRASVMRREAIEIYIAPEQVKQTSSIRRALERELLRDGLSIEDLSDLKIDWKNNGNDTTYVEGQNAIDHLNTKYHLERFYNVTLIHVEAKVKPEIFDAAMNVLGTEDVPLGSQQGITLDKSSSRTLSLPDQDGVGQSFLITNQGKKIGFFKILNIGGYIKYLVDISVESKPYVVWQEDQEIPIQDHFGVNLLLKKQGKEFLLTNNSTNPILLHQTPLFLIDPGYENRNIVISSEQGVLVTQSLKELIPASKSLEIPVASGVVRLSSKGFNGKKQTIISVENAAGNGLKIRLEFSAAMTTPLGQKVLEYDGDYKIYLNDQTKRRGFLLDDVFDDFDRLIGRILSQNTEQLDLGSSELIANRMVCAYLDKDAQGKLEIKNEEKGAYLTAASKARGVLLDLLIKYGRDDLKLKFSIVKAFYDSKIQVTALRGQNMFFVVIPAAGGIAQLDNVIERVKQIAMSTKLIEKVKIGRSYTTQGNHSIYFDVVPNAAMALSSDDAGKIAPEDKSIRKDSRRPGYDTSIENAPALGEQVNYGGGLEILHPGLDEGFGANEAMITAAENHYELQKNSDVVRWKIGDQKSVEIMISMEGYPPVNVKVFRNGNNVSYDGRLYPNNQLTVKLKKANGPFEETALIFWTGKELEITKHQLFKLSKSEIEKVDVIFIPVSEMKIGADQTKMLEALNAVVGVTSLVDFKKSLKQRIKTESMDGIGQELKIEKDLEGGDTPLNISNFKGLPNFKEIYVYKGVIIIVGDQNRKYLATLTKSGIMIVPKNDLIGIFGEKMSDEVGVYRIHKGQGSYFGEAFGLERKSNSIILKSIEGKSHVLDMEKLFGKLTVNMAMQTGSPTGGIDLNSKNLQMGVGGEKIEIKFDPAMIAQFKQGDFSGVYPVILQITPIINILPLLGLKEEDQKLAKV